MKSRGATLPLRSSCLVGGKSFLLASGSIETRPGEKKHNGLKHRCCFSSASQRLPTTRSQSSLRDKAGFLKGEGEGERE